MTRRRPVEVRRPRGRSRVIDIDGEVTAASEPTLMEAYGARSDRRRTNAVVLNFDGLDYMNAAASDCSSRCWCGQPAAPAMLAYGLSEHYRQIFELTRLDEAISIHATRPSAAATARSLTGSDQ